jgi:protein-disulfide isomerase
VTMIEYSSLTCPHCAAFHTDTLPGLKQRFIDAGKLRLVVRDFPLDESALKGAMIAHCAGPERYVRFMDVFFAQQQSWARAADPVAALKQLAKLGGLGEEQVDACLADKALEEAVLQARLTGQQTFNIRSTPTFIIDGKAYPGNRSVDEFAAIIEPLLPQ